MAKVKGTGAQVSVGRHGRPEARVRKMRRVREAISLCLDLSSAGNPKAFSCEARLPTRESVTSPPCTIWLKSDWSLSFSVSCDLARCRERRSILSRHI